MKLPTSIEVIMAACFLGTISVFSVLLRDSGISSFQQVFFRFLIPIIILLGIMVITKSEWIKKKDIPKFVILGGILCILYITFLSALFVGVSIVEAEFLINLQPFFIILIAVGILGERVKKIRLFAAALTVFGAALLLQIWAMELLKAPPIGYLLAVFNSLAYALYITASSRIRKTIPYSDITIMTFTFIFGFVWWIILFVSMNVFGIAGDLTQFNFNMSNTTWLYIFGISIFSTLIPYTLLSIGVKKIAVSRVGVIMLLEPLMASAFGILLFGETLVLVQIVGVVIILVGVIVSEKS